MLVAYGPEGQPLIAEEVPLEQLQHWSRERSLHCPNCRGIVHVRGGPEKRTQLHFAHQKGECAWSTESESVRHAQGKLLLSHWLRDQFPQARITLEERLPEPNRIADVFVRHPDGRQWAVEFQCAPLDIEEWRHRHLAYRTAGIMDTWIIGNNRKEKQEAFLEAVLQSAHELLFLDPLVTPPRIWLRWPISRQQAHNWQDSDRLSSSQTSLAGWVGRLGYGMSLMGHLAEVYLDPQGHLHHPQREQITARTSLLHQMEQDALPTEEHLISYLQQSVGMEALRIVLLPLLKAYLLDPDLLRRYNYGRGQQGQPVSPADHQRIQKACRWLTTLALHGFPPSRIQLLLKELPFVGAYAALAGYGEMLLSLL
ncbi:competence protein CoiA [Tengunoibacter tsumagoiensis]|uniref:Competence protein CoiA n=1 Tax=Tengunoibacter tsumagoiensis TaxID=2014871 RepID=A0A402A0M6_9CHLR|nr:competence protein CoiA family protein [Tengunoibacter tsumagoiensis]GCE12561.1 hypothetical protein KTT_24200 [Tengunoibacter tsumagoiensis]